MCRAFSLVIDTGNVIPEHSGVVRKQAGAVHGGRGWLVGGVCGVGEPASQFP